MAKLILNNKNKDIVYEIEPDEYTIGKSNDNDIALNKTGVSRHHAMLLWEDNSYYIKDLNSTNGVRVNGVLTTHQRLHSGDILKLGQAVFTFEDDSNSDASSSSFKSDTSVTSNDAVSNIEALEARVSRKKAMMEYYDSLGKLAPYLKDDTINEIMVNSKNQVYIERQGKMTLTPIKFENDAEIMEIIDKIVIPLGRYVNEDSPYVDAHLLDGSRVNIIIPPLATKGPCITIRKFSAERMTVQDLINFGTFTEECAEFFHLCIAGRRNIIIAGNTGSGKTTLLNVLASFIPNNERIVTIEDSLELSLPQEHIISLEARPANIEGEGKIAIRDLVHNSLRMRPDRIVIGECRGGEALDMLQAMSTGHDGSMTTLHANNPRDALVRLETLVLMAGFDLPLKAIRYTVANSIHLVFHLSRLQDGSRKITYVTQLTGMEGNIITLQEIFVFEREGLNAKGKVVGKLRPTGMIPTFAKELQLRGLKVDFDMFKEKN